MLAIFKSRFGLAILVKQKNPKFTWYLNLEKNPIWALASKWDYDNDWLGTLIYNDILPHTFNQEHREHWFREYLDLEANPIRGLKSKWDFDNDCWNKCLLSLCNVINKRV
ncbi:hypothetical protein GWI33_020207 [Rhynchophorus ferrugineus]|uniref:Uncharacterized protein n=1 Tax=Rhynchophorus ferrugineus TaxID=354439 RepID=A0A834LZN3_RHYFE|nr:hypothetical protein GWI33_020207 [Rhynchophorus ferrugineus]